MIADHISAGLQKKWDICVPIYLLSFCSVRFRQLRTFSDLIMVHIAKVILTFVNSYKQLWQNYIKFLKCISTPISINRALCTLSVCILAQRTVCTNLAK